MKDMNQSTFLILINKISNMNIQELEAFWNTTNVQKNRINMYSKKIKKAMYSEILLLERIRSHAELVHRFRTKGFLKQRGNNPNISEIAILLSNLLK